MHLPTIRIFTTGGSIDKRYDPKVSDFVVSDPTVGEMLREANVSLDFSIEPILRKDSLEIRDDDRQMILEKVGNDPHRHIVITHGSDTMIETARILRAVTEKVIVVTGAMQPAAFKQTDAAINVGGALIAVQTLPEGVYIVMNGRVLNPDISRKNLDTDSFEEF